VAPLPIIADTFRTAIIYEDATGEFLGTNIIHLFGPGIDQDSIGQACQDNISSAMFGVTSSSVVIDRVEVTPLDGVTPTRSYDLSGITGESAGNFIPNTALVVTFNTGTRGRSFQGSAYVGFVAEGITADGIFEQVETDSTVAGWTQFGIDMLGDFVAQVVASYELELVTLIEEWVADQRNDTQRRRLNSAGI